MQTSPRVRPSTAAPRPSPGATAQLAACARAFEQHFDYVHRALRRHGVRPADVEDLAQEVFIVMWRRWSEFDHGRPLRAWLSGIVFNVTGTHYRRLGRESPATDCELVDEAPRGEEALALSRAQAVALAALDRLSPEYRSVLVLHDFEGMPMRGIAALVQVPLFTAYTRLRRARKAFAAAVERLQEGTPLGSLLAAERSPPRAPEELRGRVRRRLRALLLGAELAPAPIARPPAFTLARVLVAGAGLAVALVAVGPSRGPRRARPVAPVAPTPVALSAAPPPVSAPSLARGLVGYWRFDEAAGSTLARDLSGRGRDCVLHGRDPRQAWITGRFGGAVDLARRGWLDCPQPGFDDGGPRAFTVSAWVKVASLSAHGNHALVSRQLGTGRADYLYLGFSNRVILFNSDVWRQRIQQRFTGTGGWQHVAFTRAGDAAALFLDGQLVGRATLGVGLRQPVEGPLLLGGGMNRPGRIRELFDGALDEVALHDRALGPDEIAAMAAGLQPALPVR